MGLCVYAFLFAAAYAAEPALDVAVGPAYVAVLHDGVVERLDRATGAPVVPSVVPAAGVRAIEVFDGRIYGYGRGVNVWKDGVLEALYSAQGGSHLVTDTTPFGGDGVGILGWGGEGFYATGLAPSPTSGLAPGESRLLGAVADVRQVARNGAWVTRSVLHAPDGTETKVKFGDRCLFLPDGLHLACSGDARSRRPPSSTGEDCGAALLALDGTRTAIPGCTVEAVGGLGIVMSSADGARQLLGLDGSPRAVLPAFGPGGAGSRIVVGVGEDGVAWLDGGTVTYAGPDAKPRWTAKLNLLPAAQRVANHEPVIALAGDGVTVVLARSDGHVVYRVGADPASVQLTRNGWSPAEREPVRRVHADADVIRFVEDDVTRWALVGRHKPVYCGGLVVAEADGVIEGDAVRDGAQRWSTPLAPSWHIHTCDGRYVLLRGPDGVSAVIDGTNGRRVLDEPSGLDITGAGATGAAVAQVLVDGRAAGWTLVDLVSGRRVALGARSTVAGRLDDGALVLVETQGSSSWLVAVKGEEVRWRLPILGGIKPWVVGDAVYLSGGALQIAMRGALVALRGATGEVEWFVPIEITPKGIGAVP